jgi:hypothetical protein
MRREGSPEHPPFTAAGIILETGGVDAQTKEPSSTGFLKVRMRPGRTSGAQPSVRALLPLTVSR